MLKQTSNINICAKCEESKNELLRSIESKVENGLQLTLNILDKNFGYLLKKNQKKSDYKISDNNNFTPGITNSLFFFFYFLHIFYFFFLHFFVTLFLLTFFF